MTITEIIEGIGELARKSNMNFEEAVAWISQNDRDENILPWEETTMKTNETVEMLIKTYAEFNDLDEEDVREDIRKGWIDGEMLFQDWLKYEGIRGYGSVIVKIFHDCEEAGLKIEE